MCIIDLKFDLKLLEPPDTKEEEENQDHLESNHQETLMGGIHMDNLDLQDLVVRLDLAKQGVLHKYLGKYLGIYRLYLLE
jgi:hypothetical protein